MRLLIFGLLILSSALIVSCNPAEEAGNTLIQSYENSKKAIEQVNLKNIQRAVQMYRTINGKYPQGLEDIESMMDSPVDMELYQYNPETGKVHLINP
ncbi:MAG: type II secretion system protein GspG [Candidatus Mariimomonas ferrooxydans]